MCTGIEYREAAQVLNGKNERKVESGMIFNITVGLQNLEDKTNGPYALMVADTVVVKDASSAPEVMLSWSSSFWLFDFVVFCGHIFGTKVFVLFEKLMMLCLRNLVLCCPC